MGLFKRRHNTVETEPAAEAASVTAVEPAAEAAPAPEKAATAAPQAEKAAAPAKPAYLKRPVKVPPRIEYVNLDGLWNDEHKANVDYTCTELTDEVLEAVEAKLGRRLPASYVYVMRRHNGGILNRCVFETDSIRVNLTGMLGVGSRARYSLTGSYGSEYLTRIYRHDPKLGVVIANTVQPGQGLVFLDYSDPEASEPAVSYSNTASGVTRLADSFSEFVVGLKEIKY